MSYSIKIFALAAIVVCLSASVIVNAIPSAERDLPQHQTGFNDGSSSSADSQEKSSEDLENVVLFLRSYLESKGYDLSEPYKRDSKFPFNSQTSMKLNLLNRIILLYTISFLF